MSMSDAHNLLATMAHDGIYEIREWDWWHNQPLTHKMVVRLRYDEDRFSTVIMVDETHILYDLLKYSNEGISKHHISNDIIVKD